MTDAGKIYTMIGIFRRPIAFEARGQGLYITGLQKSQDEEKITGKNAQDKHLELWAKASPEGRVGKAPCEQSLLPPPSSSSESSKS